MKRIVPDYYEQFACIKGDCRHNCCIGWEIDIDPDTLAIYDSLPAVTAHVCREGNPHFILGEGERCPFLNGDNLCELILQLGEEALCDVCAMHPRFCNEYDDRLELGLGLCCEAAARLILTRVHPTALLGGDDDPLRQEMFAVLQNRTRPVKQRVSALLALCKARPPVITVAALRALERLDKAWSILLDRLEGPTDTDGFDRHMAERQTEYEQLLVYLVYRHFPVLGAEKTAALAAVAYQLLHAMGVAVWTQTGAFTVDDQCELARLFSTEMEYSDENLAILFP